MKTETKKIIEFGLWVANLTAFIVINLFALRKFHWISVIIMAVPIVITALFLMKYDYVDWKKKSPSVWPLLISFVLYLLSRIVLNIQSAPTFIYVIFFIVEFVSVILSIIFFIRFMIVYNKAFRIHQIELGLDKEQRLYNLSMPVLWVMILFIVWSFTVSFADRIVTVTSPAKYEIVTGDYNYEFFPDSLPEDASNVEFNYTPGIWLAKSKSYVKFEATEEYLDEYESIYGSDAEKVTTVDAWSDYHINSSKICKLISDNYLNKDNCDVYVAKKGFSLQGYAVNRDTNELFFFYDGAD